MMWLHSYSLFMAQGLALGVRIPPDWETKHITTWRWQILKGWRAEVNWRQDDGICSSCREDQSDEVFVYDRAFQMVWFKSLRSFSPLSLFQANGPLRRRWWFVSCEMVLSSPRRLCRRHDVQSAVATAFTGRSRRAAASFPVSNYQTGSTSEKDRHTPERGFLGCRERVPPVMALLERRRGAAEVKKI